MNIALSFDVFAQGDTRDSGRGAMAFGRYIRREREGREMTLTELARRVDEEWPAVEAALDFLLPQNGC